MDNRKKELINKIYHYGEGDNLEEFCEDIGLRIEEPEDCDDTILIEVRKPENERQQQFLETFEKLYDVYIRKNRDYGNSFGLSYDKYGPVAGLVRIEDKMNRLENLLMHQQNAMVKDEAILDTVEDAINYLIMLKMELEADKENE